MFQWPPPRTTHTHAIHVYPIQRSLSLQMIYALGTRRRRRRRRRQWWRRGGETRWPMPPPAAPRLRRPTTTTTTPPSSAWLRSGRGGRSVSSDCGQSECSESERVQRAPLIPGCERQKHKVGRAMIPPSLLHAAAQSRPRSQRTALVMKKIYMMTENICRSASSVSQCFRKRDKSKDAK
jgi:hypothetical protein